MPWRKDKGMISKKQILVRMALRLFLNYLKSIILQWERLCMSGKDSCQSSLEWMSQQIHPMWCSVKWQKNPRATFQTLQASVSMLNIDVHVRPPVWQLNLVRNVSMQQDTPSSKSTAEQLKTERISVLQWSSQSPDIDLIELLWWVKCSNGIMQHCKKKKRKN